MTGLSWVLSYPWRPVAIVRCCLHVFVGDRLRSLGIGAGRHGSKSTVGDSYGPFRVVLVMSQFRLSAIPLDHYGSLLAIYRLRSFVVVGDRWLALITDRWRLLVIFRYR